MPASAAPASVSIASFADASPPNRAAAARAAASAASRLEMARNASTSGAHDAHVNDRGDAEGRVIQIVAATETRREERECRSVQTDASILDVSTRVFDHRRDERSSLIASGHVRGR